MFPFDTEEEISQESAVPVEFEIDYGTGQLTGRMVEGLEAIKVWIFLALKTPRYEHVIYSWDYGSELETLIGKSYPKEYMESEVKGILEDCLLVHEHIKSISKVEVTTDGDALTVEFTANTTYGEININV